MGLQLVHLAHVMLLLLLEVAGLLVHHPVPFMLQASNVAMESLHKQWLSDENCLPLHRRLQRERERGGGGGVDKCDWSCHRHQASSCIILGLNIANIERPVHTQVLG